MRTIALLLEYDGTEFLGSQFQAQGRTVQSELERAWTRFTGEQLRWTLAGRTDSGVHALGQVGHVQTATTHPLETIWRAMNALLPPDLAAPVAWEMPAGFHARFSAQRRDYRYLIVSSRTRSALLRHRVLHAREPLDVAAMHQALQTLLGEHDFAAFTGGGQEAQEGPTVRRCLHAACTVRDDAALSGSLITVEIAANGFLRHMVRNIVGTLLLVGSGRLDLAGFTAILEGCDRRLAGPTAPPHGLYLVSVGYDPALVPLAQVGRAQGEPNENL